MKFIVIVIIVLGGLVYGYTSMNSPEQNTEPADVSAPADEQVGADQSGPSDEEDQYDDAMMKEDKDEEVDTMMEKTEEVMEKESEEVMTETEVTEPVTTPEPTASVPGVYADYSPERVATASGDIILFFHAAWCPSCRTLDQNITANEGNIPSGVTILKLDYDTQTALKSQYGVRTQHTMVQVDQNGNKIQLWSGGNTLESVVAKL